MRIIIAIAILAIVGNIRAEVYHFAVHPILPQREIKAAYTPLAEYLSAKTGHTLQLHTTSNYVSFWQEMKKGRYDIILDAAHITDYRIQKMNYKVFAKFMDVVSFALVTREDLLIFEPVQLVGKRVASLPAPSRGGLALDNFFPNPMRQPRIVEVADASKAIDMLLAKQVDGAVIPTPLLTQYPQFNFVLSLGQWPHMAFSVSPKVPDQVATALKLALITAPNDPQGQQMLQHLNLPGFEEADAKRYAGYADFLKDYWGY